MMWGSMGATEGSAPRALRAGTLPPTSPTSSSPGSTRGHTAAHLAHKQLPGLYARAHCRLRPPRPQAAPRALRAGALPPTSPTSSSPGSTRGRTAAHLAHKQLPGLYARAHCLVQPSRGEGWGRPHMEAMSMGLPVISTYWGGVTAYLHEQNALLVPVTEQAIPDGPFEGHLWGEPDVGELRRRVKRCSVREHTNAMCRIGETEPPVDPARLHHLDGISAQVHHDGCAPRAVICPRGRGALPQMRRAYESHRSGDGELAAIADRGRDEVRRRFGLRGEGGSKRRNDAAT
eukprot:gene57898-biopygen63148